VNGTSFTFSPAPPLPAAGGSLRAAALTAGAAAFTALLVAATTPLVRVPCALVLAFVLVTLTLARPTIGVMVTFVYLVFLAFLRRLLIFEAGWWPVDPMLLVAPLVAGVLIVKLFFVERRPLAPDLLSKLVLLFLGLSVVQIANPGGGGVLVGSVGLLYVTLPLTWFFIGREVLDQSATVRLTRLVVVLGVVVAAYGLLQSQLVHPVWDRAWVDQVATLRGYSSLNVGGTLRSFGTFSSAGEYQLFVGAALAVSWALALSGRAFALLPLPLLGVALFLASGRGPLILTGLAVVVLIGLSTRRPLTALVVVLAATGLAFGASRLFASDLSAQASSSSNDLVSHQLGGVTDPLNPNSSTLLIHVQAIVDGMKWSLRHPQGQGTASTTLVGGGSRGLGDQSRGSTELDLTNAFVGLGVVGGVLYLAIVILTLYQAVKSHFAGKPAALPIIGVLIVCVGQWLIGGNYALVTLIWLLIGAVAAMSARPREPAPG
jgi:hypothetical protein